VNFSQVLPGLFVGSCPTKVDDINHLKTECGITALLSLQTDDDLDYLDLDWGRIEDRCREKEIEVRRIPIRDFDGMDLRKKLPRCVEALDELLRNGRTVYTHCNVGTGRSPDVAIAYLVWRQGWSVDDAIDQVTKCRSCSSDIDSLMRSEVEVSVA
jgi:protein-tyrosine phosphatase